MPQRLNPLSIQVLGELPADRFVEEFDRLAKRIDNDQDARSSWVQKTRDIDKQLRGEDRRKNKPWKHAAELSIPLTKKLLRRWTPVLYNLYAFADPLSHFKATQADAALAAPTAEEFFTWLVRDYMENTGREIRYLVHDIGAKGMGYLGVSWDYRREIESRVIIAGNLFPQGVPQNERLVSQTIVEQYDLQFMTPELRAQLAQAVAALMGGAPYVSISYERVVSDKPKITRHDPLDVVVPPDSFETENAEYVCLLHDFTPSQLRQLAKDGILNAQAVEALIEDAGSADDKKDVTRRHDYSNADMIRREQQEEAGILVVEEHKPIRVHQVYCMLDKNGDGIDERCVLWYSPLGKRRLALHDFPFSFRYWPVFRFDYEDVDRRPYLARGMGEHLQDIQEQFNKQYRATADAIDIQLAPTFQVRMTSKLMPRTVKWGPGRFIPVSQIGDIAPIEKSPFNLHQYLQDRGELKTFAEEMVGSIDAALAATGRRLERRTAFEVQQVSGQIEAMQGMDSAIFQSSMAKVFQCVWELWLDFGQDEIYYMVTGTQQPQPFRKSEHSYKYQLTPAGTPGNTNRNAELGRMLQLLQIVGQFAPDLLNREFILRYIARLIDPRMAEQIVLSPIEQQQMQLLAGVAQQTAQGDLPEIMKTIMAGSRGGPSE